VGHLEVSFRIYFWSRPVKYSKLKKLPLEKWSSLFGFFISDEEKKVNIMRLFSSQFTKRPYKLECLSMASISSLV
jgi:hypothetical protein